MAQVAVTAVTLDHLSKTHWLVRAFFLTSLLSGCASVYYAMYQLRTLGRLVGAKDVRSWLRGFPYGCSDNIIGSPSAAAVTILDTPRLLIDMAAGSFVCGLSLYSVFTLVKNLDIDAARHDSRNVVITYFTSMCVIGMLYNRTCIFDILTYVKPSWSTWTVKVGSQDSYVYGPDPNPGDPHLPPGLLKPISDTRWERPRSLKAEPYKRPDDNVSHLVVGNTSLADTTEEAPRSAHIESITYSTALQETILARKKSIEADERLLEALEKQKAALVVESESSD